MYALKRKVKTSYVLRYQQTALTARTRKDLKII